MKGIKMQIDISAKARVYLARKAKFFLAKKRVPRIVVAERSCRGALFRIFFEPAQKDDLAVDFGEFKLYAASDMIAEFGGFNLELEQFFFNKRLRIEPIKQSYACNCSIKCGHNGLNQNKAEV